MYFFILNGYKIHMTKEKEFWRDHLQRNPSVLDAGTRIWEIVCGLIMVLTFTGSVSAATAGREEVRLILWAALGCNTAWGIVDAFMYLMSVWLERDLGLKALKSVRTETREVAIGVIKEYVPAIIARVVRESQLEEIRYELVNLPAPPSRAFLMGRDIKNAGIVFLLVFLSTFPVVIPFLFRINLFSAMRISNVIVLLMLFACGMFLGGQTGYKRFLVGLVLALIGAVLVSITMALGG
jgi:hypothetical protein